MLRNIVVVCVLLMAALSLCGCFLLVAGAGAGGTVLWQAGKVASEESASMERAVMAAESAFRAKSITLKDKVIKDEVTQLRGEDQAGKKVAVDVFSVGSRNSRVEIRYGLGDEVLARDLLNEIKRRL
ncbi:MAG: DUF3568 family protein [Candidatus Omnitrophica bacterium]|nr:DUF3568 family protein [Candidatus Omnitrophota bacterium]